MSEEYLDKFHESEEIKELRQALDLTQERFAQRLGVSFSTVSRWETGRGRPSPLARQRLDALRSGLPLAQRKSDLDESEQTTVTNDGL